MYKKNFKNKLKKQFMQGNFEETSQNNFINNIMNMRKYMLPRMIIAAFVIAGSVTAYQNMTDFNSGSFLEKAQASYEDILNNSIVYQKVTLESGKDFLTYIEATFPKNIPEEVKKQILESEDSFGDMSFESWTTEGKSLTKHGDGMVFLHSDNDTYTNMSDVFNGAISGLAIPLGGEVIHDFEGESFEFVTGGVIEGDVIDMGSISKEELEKLLEEGMKGTDGMKTIAIEKGAAFTISDEEFQELKEGEVTFIEAESIMLNGAIEFEGEKFPLSGVKKTEDMLPELEKLVKSGEAEYLGKSIVAGKNVVGYSVSFDFPMIMNGTKEKNYEYFYFDVETKKLVQQVTVAEVNGKKYEMSVQKIVEEKVLPKKGNEGLFKPETHNLK